MILFWGILIGGVTLVVRLILSLGRDRKSTDALAILKQRYARGEIDREEYERMRKELSL
jgi:putative membrane protein